MPYPFIFARFFLYLLLLSLFLLLGVKYSEAGLEIETPVRLEGGQIISVEQAWRLHQSSNAFFFDMRSPVNYGKGHIPTAKPLPYRENSAKAVDFQSEVDFVDLSELPQDKGETIVFYSHGTTGWKSYKAAALAIRSGYQNVRWLRGGLQSWEKEGLPLEY